MARLPDQLGRIYQEHRQGLFTTALAITRSVRQAEDAVHEAFGRLLVRQARPTGDPVAYVFAAVRNAAIDQRRAARKHQRLRGEHDSLFNGQLQLPSPPDQAIHREQCSRLAEAVDQLPASARQVVVMRAFAGLSFARIAEATGQPLPTVASRYRRALSSLRACLEPIHD
jgi:RNA polymerase sigma-70 factor (ECF subfamily)